MALMQGDIHIESRPSQGCTFNVSIPYIQKMTHQSQEEPSEKRPKTLPEINPHNYKILYVEDNPTNLRLVTSVVNARKDIQLITAHTGTLGLDMAYSHLPDLILLDINLPGMNGMEIQKRLRDSTDTSHIPVIAITANALPSDIELGKAVGFKEYLTKPLNVSHFLAMLQQYLPTEDQP